MKNYLDKLFILEGIVLALLGICFFINPTGTFLNFTLICGILMAVTGVVRIVRAFRSDEKMYYILTGIIDILFGIMVVISPVFVVENIILFFGVWALIKGIYTLVLIIKYKKFGFNIPTALTILSIVLGGYIMLCPVVIIYALPFVPYFLGTCFIVGAATEIYLGFKL